MSSKIQPPHLWEKAAKIFRNTEFLTNEFGCKLWPRSTFPRGYGHICTKNKENGKSVHFSTHRLAWELSKGPIPPGLCVCHTCDVRRCCNIKHLFLATNEENLQDMWNKKRNPRGERHPHAILTEAQVAEIKWYGHKLSRSKLAKKYGVSDGCIGNIREGSNWTWVEPKAPAEFRADHKGDE